MRILIVEDDPTLADGLTRSLQRADYAVDCIHDGEQADHVLAAQSYDLVILDLGLPKLDGLEVMGGGRWRGATVPVLVLTAHDALADRVKGLDQVELSVEDNGPGIPPAELERVFERFHRVLGSGAEGCGLGLAIVHEIAQSHNAKTHLGPGAGGSGTR